ncbi:MAG: hypothetical protein R3200_07960 [Xanthomonadales bacterium]|nr:hypothetical protein [Xanthomonadales bacterium]
MVDSKPKLPWLRILAEGTTIVVSILLAFAIDAWWQGRAERHRADALLTDFQATQVHAEQWLVGNQRVLEALTAFAKRWKRPNSITS